MKSFFSAVLFAATIAAGTSEAATVAFPTDLGPGNTFSVGGVTGTVTANAGCEIFGCTPQITVTPEGLGVSTGRFDDPAIDGFLLKESITVTFDTPVVLTQIDFGAVDADDNWDISTDGNTVASGVSTDPYGLPPNTLVTSFTVTAKPAGFLFRRPNDFTLAGFTTAPAVAPVPLPAGGLLLLGGLGLMTRLRRRSRA